MLSCSATSIKKYAMYLRTIDMLFVRRIPVHLKDLQRHWPQDFLDLSRERAVLLPGWYSLVCVDPRNGWCDLEIPKQTWLLPMCTATGCDLVIVKLST